MRIGKFLAAISALAAGLIGAVAHAAESTKAHPWEVNLQPAATPVMESIHDFHNLLLVITIAITVFVLILLGITVVRFGARRNPVPSRTTHHTMLEVAWTVVPIVILVVIGIPSFKLLYLSDVTPKADMTIKAIGHQWYWTYEYPDHGKFSFDANMIPPEEIKPGQLRLLETDNTVVVPVDTTVRVQITATDVLHAWAVPAFGVKRDAVPGRLNETWFKATKEGIFYGQCSELCGVNHGFMPIKVEVVSRQKFDQWVAGKRRAALPRERSGAVAQAGTPAR